MSQLYVYLISSLPSLFFGSKPPFLFESFAQKCREFIPEKEADIVASLNSDKIKEQELSTIKRWLEFETVLKNELVKLRAIRKKVGAEKYLRPDGFALPSVYHAAEAAQRNPSPLEGERILSEAKWKFLDELAIGHYFDLDFLVCYGLKLIILERWEMIDKADKAALLDQMTSRG